MEEPEYNEHGSRGSFDVGNTSDSFVESQSTQLLNFVLGKSEPPPQTWNNNAQAVGNEDTGSADHSSNSNSRGSGNAPTASASVVPYHLYGLASTPTQTPAVSSDESQKENEQANAQSFVGLGTKQTPSRPSDCVQPSSKGSLTPSRALSTNGQDPSSVCSPPPQATKAVSFLSSPRQVSIQKAPTKTAAMRYRRRPSPSFPSQDSFAGPTASQDPDLFVATSRQFEIPLDQLGRPISQDVSPVESRVAKASTASSEPAGPQVAMSGYSLSSSSPGNILVANSDSSGASQDSLGIKLYAISQEPTQILDASDASMSDHVNEEVAEQIIEAPTRVEPTQVTSQEATQILEESPSAEIGQTSAVVPSADSNPRSLLSMVSPERRQRYMQQLQRKGDSQSGPAPGPSMEHSHAESSVGSERRSLLQQLPPEKRSKYMRHTIENSAPISEASRMATAGTSQGTGNSGRPKSSLPPTREEEVVDDSEQQIDMDISPVKGRTSRDEEVIPPSESDAPEYSREEEMERSEDELEVARMLPVKPPSGILPKGKQKADPSSRIASPRNPASDGSGRNIRDTTSGKTTAYFGTKEVSGASPAKAPASASSSRKNVLGAQGRSPGTARVPEGAEMAPLEPQHGALARRGHGQPQKTSSKNGGDASSPIASTSAAAMHREQLPPTPAAPVAIAPEPEEDSPEIPLARIVKLRMEEEESEGGDDEGVVTEEAGRPHNLRPGPLTRKRKRRNAALTTKKGGKAKAAPRKANVRGASVAPPPSKKARTTIAKRFGARIGTQVFALFKSDSCFYGAEVHTLNGTRAHVKFFDGYDDPNLGIAQMRRFDLRTGDCVIPGSKTHKAKVIDDSLWASENEVTVEYTEGPEEGLELSVPADGLRIPARTIQSQWKDRLLDASEIVPATRKLLKDTPSPSKNSVMNVTSSRATRNKLLSKHGIIITQGPGKQNWSREKEKYVNIVKDNGGIMLSDWQDVFSLQGKHSSGNKRWTIQRTDVKFAPKDKTAYDRVFLVSDKHNQKPKYLLALAFGIPCVSVDWLDHLAAGEELPWTRFLLAAGHSEPLGAPVSQMVDLDWGSAAEHLTEIMENRVPHKVLSGASVICVGADLFPLPAKKGAADAVLEASRTVPRIILAMGAERVEAVADVKHASEDLSQYTYVVIKEALSVPRVEGATYVDVNWIKECLIAGRLLPLREWE